MKILLLILLLSIPAYSHGTQKTRFDIKKREQELVAIRKKAIAALNESSDLYEAQMILFKKLLKETLHYKASLIYPFDSLKKYIEIQTSADRKIRFYTWIPTTGGTWYYFDQFIQFKKKDGSMGIKEKGKEDLEYDICQVHELRVPGKEKVYITFGWGTHGGGAGYTVVDAWKITNAGLAKAEIIDTNGLHCAHFVQQEKGRLIISTYRALDLHQSHIVYDTTLKAILFDYYEVRPDNKEFDASLNRTNKIVKMQFNGKVFRRVDA